MEVSGSILTSLTQLASNEKSAPMLLPHDQEIIDAAQDQIRNQTERVEHMKSEIATMSEGREIKQKICQALDLETLRWQFLVRSYYTARFKKIQTNIARGIIPAETLLAPVEIEFCNQLKAAMENHSGPAELTFTTGRQELTGFVFFQALVNKGDTALSSDASFEPVTIRKGQIYFARFENIYHMYDAHEIVLI